MSDSDLLERGAAHALPLDGAPAGARSLVVFGEDWGGHPSSTQHLVRRLAKDRGVLWVNSIGMRAPAFNRRDLTRAGQKVFRAFRSVTHAPAADPARPRRLSVLEPLAVSWPGSRIADRLNAHALGYQVNAAVAARGLGLPILWTSLPTAVVAAQNIRARAVVYYCGDDFGAIAGVDHAAVLAMERRLVRQADLIFAASDVLAARFPAEKTVLLPHGVDFDLFAAPAERAADLPSRRPVAGYYGSIASWLDLDMLAATARALPDYDFVLIGPVSIDVSAIAHLPNVTLLGPRPHAELPRYSQHWTVSLLPFKANGQIEACNPLKLREYLAAGTPVVSTPFPALMAYRDLIEIARGPDAFAEAIRRASQDRHRNERRRARVCQEGWDARAADAARHLERL